MRGCLRWTLIALLAAAWLASPALAKPIPSKDAGGSLDAERATIETFLARDEVARALATTGLSHEQVEERLAQLSVEDLSTLAANVDQIQAAGEVPNYIWILLAVLMGVVILATIF